jgi:hypothetical protein
MYSSAFLEKAMKWRVLQPVNAMLAKTARSGSAR